MRVVASSLLHGTCGDICGMQIILIWILPNTDAEDCSSGRNRILCTTYENALPKAKFGSSSIIIL